MNRKIIPVVVAVLAVAAGLVWWLRHEGAARHFTGFVEGEERVIRAEVPGRVLDVAFAEGATVPADAVVARIDASDIDARIASRRQEVAVIDADIDAQEERIRLVETTWPRDVKARKAELQQAESAARNAQQTFVREQELARTGASTAQMLDDARARSDQANAAVDRARDILARTEAEEANVGLARRLLDSLRRKRELTESQIAELEVTRAKYDVRSPSVPTVVQTQFLWPGELAQPGTPVLSVLDPMDKYVQIYVPVRDVQRVRVGTRVEVELDSAPGARIPGEVSFVADQANFTPEKIETRGDRLGQVYRAKVRILEGAERLQPGTEGNVYLVENRDGPPAVAGAGAR